MKKYQIKLRIWLMLGILFGSFLSQPMVAFATSNDRIQSEEPENVQIKEENESDIVEQFLQKNNLIRGEDGKLYTTTPSTYVKKSIHDILSGNQLTKAANQVVYVDPSTNVANIDIHLSNGSREYGWYGKRVNGQIALCIEQGVAVNVGSNGGYTSVLQDTELMKRISLVKYYGIVLPGHTLQREIMTQILAYEQQGIHPTSISGIFSMADYQAFKSNVMANVNKFYTKPSFDGQTITLKVGESVTLTDTTGAFSNYESTPLAPVNGLNMNKQGNNVTITATKDANITNSIVFEYSVSSTYKGAPLIFQHPYTQNVMLGRINDPARTRFNINVLKNGNARIRKVDETTKQPLAGAVFRFTTSDGQSREITTGSCDLE